MSRVSPERPQDLRLEVVERAVTDVDVRAATDDGRRPPRTDLVERLAGPALRQVERLGRRGGMVTALGLVVVAGAGEGATDVDLSLLLVYVLAVLIAACGLRPGGRVDRRSEPARAAGAVRP